MNAGVERMLVFKNAMAHGEFGTWLTDLLVWLNDS